MYLGCERIKIFAKWSKGKYCWCRYHSSSDREIQKYEGTDTCELTGRSERRSFRKRMMNSGGNVSMKLGKFNRILGPYDVNSWSVVKHDMINEREEDLF